MVWGNLPSGSLLLPPPFSRAFGTRLFSFSLQSRSFLPQPSFSIAYGVWQFLLAAAGPDSKQQAIITDKYNGYIHNIGMVNFL